MHFLGPFFAQRFPPKPPVTISSYKLHSISKSVSATMIINQFPRDCLVRQIVKVSRHSPYDYIMDQCRNSVLTHGLTFKILFETTFYLRVPINHHKHVKCTNFTQMQLFISFFCALNFMIPLCISSNISY